MITVETVRLGFAALYGVATVGLLAAVTRVPQRLRPYSYTLVGVVALAGVELLFQQFGITEISVGAGSLVVATLVSQTVEYAVLYGAVVRLAGASRRLAAVVVLTALFPIYLTEVGEVIDAGSLFGLVVVAGFVVPLPVLSYLFFGRIWRAAEQLPPRRRLLHWKTRNLILFVYAMLLVYIGTLVFQLLTDSVIQQLLLQYSGLAFSAGIPAFLIYNFTTLDETTAADVLGSVDETETPPPDPATAD